MKYLSGIVGIFTAVVVFVPLVAMFMVCPGCDRAGSTQTNRVGSDFNAIASAVRAYKIHAGEYPTTEQGLKALVERPTTPPLPVEWVKLMMRVPVDPWQNEYQYRRLPDGDPRGFEFRSLGRDGVASGDDWSSLDE